VQSSFVQSGTDGYERNLTHGHRPVNREGSRARWLALVAALAVVAGAALRPRRVVVEGPSMEPTLATGDRLVAARGRAARVGDVVAVRRPGGDRRLMVKRVVAVRGDKVVVAGDNPARSTDSRSFGPVRRREILGRVVYRYAPEGRTGRVR
jgi:nickel-type superoxide dismutase maturation protease